MRNVCSLAFGVVWHATEVEQTISLLQLHSLLIASGDHNRTTSSPNLLQQPTEGALANVSVPLISEVDLEHPLDAQMPAANSRSVTSKTRAPTSSEPASLAAESRPATLTELAVAILAAVATEPQPGATKTVAPSQKRIVTDARTAKPPPPISKWRVLESVMGLGIFVLAWWCGIGKQDAKEEVDGNQENAPRQSLWTASSCCTASLCVLLWSFMVAHTVRYDAAGTDWSGIWYGIVLFFGIDLFILTFLAFCAYHIYRLVGFTPESIAAIQGSRHTWTTATTLSFVEEYGERCVKIVDAINRRSGHVLDGIIKWSLFIPLFIPTQGQRMVAMITYGFLKIFVMLLFINSEGTLAAILFRPSRIRDGRLGRINFMLVQFVILGFYPLVTFLILHSRVMPVHAAFVQGYSWQALIWGDMMAEIIGSFFGRFEFEVYGFGDINRKTVEGVIACWVASFCAFATYTACSPESLRGNFEENMMLVHALSASVATIAETAAPRATDNGFMVLGVALVVIHFYIPEMSGPSKDVLSYDLG